jgi:hypothetical protein
MFQAASPPIISSSKLYTQHEDVSKMLGQVSVVPHTQTVKTFPPTVFGVQPNNVLTLIRVFLAAGTSTAVVK